MKKLLVILLLGIVAGAFAQTPHPRIDSLLKVGVKRGDISGVVTIIATKDKILNINCAGWQNVEKKTPVTAKSLYWIASQSKPVCGVAVMICVEDGKLDLDKPITTYLPEMNNLLVATVDTDTMKILKRTDKPITLRLLLSHTSGVTREDGVKMAAGKTDLYPLQTSVKVSSVSPLEFAPGEGYRYSNQDMALAAACIERVTEMKYEDFLQKRLFDPLGMKSATFYPTLEAQKNWVVPYGKDKAGNFVPMPKHPPLTWPLEDRTVRYPSPGGGLFCTPEDLVKFYQMLAGGGMYQGKRILSEVSVKEISTKQTGNQKEPYGLGCVANNEFFGHGGALGTQSRIYRKSDILVMYFTQHVQLPNANKFLNSFISTVDSIYKLGEANADAQMYNQ